ncbi:hypothetical protein RUM43_005365 [Polyplax serrata]|uniref:Protein CNPPD1 n=1 Tax=Polyplax serrata TaxID=468196 RepID=A0AAN8S8M0_POLSC
MLITPMLKRLCHRKQKMKNFVDHEEYLTRIAKSLYYVQIPRTNYTSLPVTELAAEIFSQTNKFSLNRLDIEEAARYTTDGCISPCLLVLALLYLERLRSSNPKYLTKVSPTELFLISLLVGSKFLQDDGEEGELNNTDWAEITGLSVQEINKAEKDFLDAINWQVYVSEQEFWKRFNSLESKVGLRQGCKRGWFTYMELNMLFQLIDLSNFVKCLWNVTTACMISYTASVLALVGSALLVGQIPGLKLKPKVPMTDISEWNVNSTSSTLSDNLINVDCNAIQDCNKSIYIDTLTDSGNITEPDCVNLLSSSWNSDHRRRGEFNTGETILEKHILNRFYRAPSFTSKSVSSSDLIELTNLINGKSGSIDSGENYKVWSLFYLTEYLSVYPYHAFT